MFLPQRSLDYELVSGLPNLSQGISFERSLSLVVYFSGTLIPTGSVHDLWFKRVHRPHSIHSVSHLYSPPLFSSSTLFLPSRVQIVTSL